jgi:8-oxo-dGTP pyrophosphatase MutT (NUDIX family)
MREPRRGAAHVGAGPPRLRWEARRLQPARPAAGWLLRRLMSPAQPLSELSPSFARLAERLARHQPVCAPEPDRKWAAVALILAPDPDSLLLIRRAERMTDPWSGHIGLPGGRREPEDADLIETAIRETWEEVGLRLSGLQPVGLLDDVVPRAVALPPIAVRPFVFALPRLPILVPGPEVASTHWVPLDQFRLPGAHAPTAIAVRGESLVVPAYVIGDLVVWGMTERILSCFFQAVS